MATSSNAQKMTFKRSEVVPSNYHLSERQYAGFVIINGKVTQTPWFDDKEEAVLELRCLEKQLGYELIETLEMEGFYPERARIVEEKYQASGRTNGLYTGLNCSDGAVSCNTAG
jgi:hypothetical protein